MIRDFFNRATSALLRGLSSFGAARLAWLDEVRLELGERRIRNWGPALVIAAACLLLPTFVFLHLNRGFDLSDGSYYYLSIREIDDILIQVQHAGLVWRLLPLPDSIWINRMALFVLLALAASGVTLQFIRLVQLGGRPAALTKVLAVSIAIGASVLYASSWLPEPSYNSIALLLSLFLTTVTLRLIRHIRAAQSSQFVLAAMLGAGAFLLLLARQPNAAILVPALGCASLVLARPSIPVSFRLIAQALAGTAAIALAVHILLEPLNGLAERTFASLSVYTDLGPGFGDRAGSFWSDITGHWRANSATLAVLVTAYLSLVQTRWSSPALKAVSAAALVIAIAAFAWRLGALEPWAPGQFRMNMASFGVLVMTAISASSSLAILVTSGKERSRHVILSIMSLVLMAGYIAQVVGTHSGWFNSLSSHSAWPGLTVLLATLIHAPCRGPVVIVPAACLLLVMQFQAFSRLSEHPYRLNTTLAGQTEWVGIRHGASRLRVDPAAHDFLTGLSEAAAIGNRDIARPILIDFSGRLPGITYHLDMRVPHSSWLISGYGSSQPAFNGVLTSLNQTDLGTAWILDAPGFRNRFSFEALEARGLCLNRDYQLVYRAERATYINAEIRLYRPAPNALTGSPCSTTSEALSD